MKEICKEINMPLAENYVLGQKAFEMQTQGMVLGVGFNSTSLTWFLSKEKSEKIVRRCLETASASHVDLKTVEKLMGSVNDLSQMCKTVCFLKRDGNMLLRSFRGDYNIVRMAPRDLKKELMVIARIAASTRDGRPLSEEHLSAISEQVSVLFGHAGSKLLQSEL